MPGTPFCFLHMLGGEGVMEATMNNRLGCTNTNTMQWLFYPRKKKKKKKKSLLPFKKKKSDSKHDLNSWKTVETSKGKARKTFNIHTVICRSWVMTVVLSLWFLGIASAQSTRLDRPQHPTDASSEQLRLVGCEERPKELTSVTLSDTARGFHGGRDGTGDH